MYCLQQWNLSSLLFALWAVYQPVRNLFLLIQHFSISIFYSFINYNSLLNIYSLVAAIRCYVGSGDIGVVNYLPQECTGPLDNACLKKTTTEKTTRSCGTALVDLCVRDTCVCISNLCNSGMPMISSKTTQLAFLLLNLTVAVFFRRMI